MKALDHIRRYGASHMWLPALMAGVATGVAARSLKWLIAEVSRMVTAGFDTAGHNYSLIATALCGILLTGIIVRRIVHMPLEHATARLKSDISIRKAVLPLRLTIAPVITSAVTLGFGGSAGAEGPIAYSGASIGSNTGRMFGMPADRLLTLMICGAGAGIAAIFKAPVGGMFFALEVLGMSASSGSVLLLALTCLVSSATASILSGGTPDIIFSPAPDTITVRWLPAVVLLGLFCGLYSAYYLTTGEYIRRRLRAIGRPLTRNIISGLILGGLLFLFPALYGEGYAVLQQLLGGNLQPVSDGSIFGPGQIIPALGGILLAKGAASYATNSGGGVAGDFAPTLFAGGIAGALFALLAAMIPGLEAIPARAFAVTAMAAVMAGSIRAPFMAIALTVEMTAAPYLLLPVALAAFVSYGVSRLIKRRLA